MPHPASHADHDALLVAAYAAGDAMGPELDAALALVATCPDCAALHHDLRAIAAATAVLPAPVRPRSRDFRLAPERAASLRPSGWRRVLGPLAGPRFAFAGPLGTGLVTLGLAGFLVAGAAGMPVTPSAGAPGGGLGSESAPAFAAPETTDRVVAPELAPRSPAPVPVSGNGGDTGNAAGGPSGGEVILSGDPAPSGPVTDTSATSTGGGALAGEVPAPSEAPKAEMPGDIRTSATPGDEVTTAQATEAPLERAPVTAPVFALAGLLLAAGVVLAGLRLVARRAVA